MGDDMPRGVYTRKKKVVKGTPAEHVLNPSPQKKAALTRKANRERETVIDAALMRGRVLGWQDTLRAYVVMDGEEFQEWLFQLTGHCAE